MTRRQSEGPDKSVNVASLSCDGSSNNKRKEIYKRNTLKKELKGLMANGLLGNRRKRKRKGKFWGFSWVTENGCANNKNYWIS